MNFSRRNFLITGAALASGSMLQSFDFLESSSTLKTFGVQLYTLRDDLPKDPKGVLKQLAGFGYKQVESFEGPKGFFWGMTNKEFKSYLDSLGMSIVSSHCDFRKDFERKAAEAGEIGMKYLICPYLGPQKSLDGFKKAADDFNKAGEICKKNGLRFAYHNHNYSFNKQEGQIPQDVMMQNTDPTLVDFEMDIYWVVSAGADPIEWLKKYPNRFRLCHIKDRAKNAAPTNFDASVDLGLGSIDFKSILAEGKKLGFKYHIVEQEKYENTTPLKSAEVDATYLKSLKF
jgi:sugar phosphate isomerase/epimerase